VRWGAGVPGDPAQELDRATLNRRHGLTRSRRKHMQKGQRAGGPALLSKLETKRVVMVGVLTRLVVPRRDHGFRRQEISIQRRNDRAQSHNPDRQDRIESVAGAPSCPPHTTRLDVTQWGVNGNIFQRWLADCMTLDRGCVPWLERATKNGSRPMGNISRRTMLGATGGMIAGGLLKTQADALTVEEEVTSLQTAQADPTKILGAPTSQLGERAPGEQPTRIMGNPAVTASSRTPIGQLQGIITPADLHFERHHAGVPAIDPDRYELLIHGMVDRPMTFTLDDLKRFPAESRIGFVECSGNGGAAYSRDAPRERSPGQIDGLLSTSEWSGVALSTLLREVGISPDASWLLAEGGDAAVMSRSIPVEKALDDAMIAYGQNGEAIRPSQGYPARLHLPGWEGNAQVKWIRRLEASDRPSMTREETSKYTDPLANGTARQFSLVMDAKSTITFPAFPFILPESGWWEIRGLAWSGRGKITRVEVSTDGGGSWVPAQLQEPVLSKCTTRFRHVWNWDGNEALLMSRAIDETGYVQPDLETLIAARGPGTSYHYNHIRPWRVESDGRVFFAQGEGV
jgi:sulfane dehydrogenase subunit SoxC